MQELTTILPVSIPVSLAILLSLCWLLLGCLCGHRYRLLALIYSGLSWTCNSSNSISPTAFLMNDNKSAELLELSSVLDIAMLNT